MILWLRAYLGSLLCEMQFSVSWFHSAQNAEICSWLYLLSTVVQPITQKCWKAYVAKLNNLTKQKKENHRNILWKSKK